MNATLIAEMKKESARLKNLAKNFDDIINVYESAPPAPVAPGQDSRTRFYGGGQSEALKASGSSRYADMTQGDICFDILNNAPNKEMGRHQIYDRAIAGGAKIKSADHLSPVLSRDEDLSPSVKEFGRLDQKPMKIQLNKICPRN